MDNSPYRSPVTDSYMLEGDRATIAKLHTVAKYQRWVLLTLLGNVSIPVVLTVLAFFTFDPPLPGEMIFTLWFLSVALAVYVFTIISVFRLSKELMNTGIAIAYTLTVFIPGISLVVLLVLSQKATSRLKQNGVRVGFFGADPNRI